MLLSSIVTINVSANSKSYWQKLGYEFDNPKPRIRYTPKIDVKVSDLPPNSNVKVDCWCESCDKFYSVRFSEYEQTCGSCRTKTALIGNKFGSSNKGKVIASMTGEKHPRWNPNKNNFARYKSRVYSITRKQNLSLLENYDKPRGLCGVEGAYQLDHIISIKYGFDQNIDPEIIGDISNLTFIPWKHNRDKSYK